MMVDPITLAVVQNNLISVANGMQETAFRCAVTPLMYEIRDCAFSLLDADTGIVAQSHGLIGFLGSLGPATKNCVDMVGKENLKPGDVVISTVPHITGSHSADVLLFTPIFYRDELFGYAATKTHVNDLGAKSYFPIDSMSIYEEGLHIPPLRIYKAGNLLPEVWEIIKWNSRAPELVWGDIQAQISGCHFAERRVTELLDKYGMETVTACIEEMYNYAERMTRRAIQEMPDGTWTAEDYLDDNGIDLDKPILMKVTVTIQGSDITIDFAGSAPEQSGPINATLISTLSTARGAIKALTTPKLPANEGCFRPIKVIAPEGSVYNPSHTAASFFYFEISARIIDMINKALYQVLPEKIPACSGDDFCGMGYFGVDPKTGKHWMSLVPCVIGQGADLFSDGENFIHPHDISSAKNAPTEVLEPTFPLFIEKVEFIQDSGGAGKHRGGVGSVLHIRLPAPATFFSFIEKGKTPHWGINGGKEGLRNYALVRSKDKGEFEVLKTTGIELKKGDSVITTAGGGGGYGNPLERELEAVREDVIDGYVSVERAKQDYGVVIDPRTFDIDIEATNKLRRELRTS
jgi:N-methylhydantoinase B